MTARVPSRRSTAEVRTSLLGAAVEIFEAHGYADATMRAVAGTAGVSMSVLHRQFETKAALFTEALLDPFLEAFDAFAGAWEGQFTAGRWTDDELIREFVIDLYASFSERRAALMAIVALREANEPELAARFDQRFAEIFAVLGELSEQEATQRDWVEPSRARDRLWMTIVFVVGQVLMAPWAPATLHQPGRPEMVDLISQVLVYGLRLDPASYPERIAPPGAPPNMPGRAASREPDREPPAEREAGD